MATSHFPHICVNLARKTSCHTQYRSDFITIAPPSAKEWLRGLDSNQDNQIQSLVCCQLHHPGVDDGNSNYRAVTRFDKPSLKLGKFT